MMADGSRIIYAETDTGDEVICRDVRHYNMNLIAAAPNMYEALELYISHQEGKRGHYCSICHNAIQQALAKAEGKIR